MSEFIVELKGLGCPNCASKIERETQKLKGIEEANMNFPNQTMAIKLDSSIQIDNALEQITKIVHSHESNVKVSLKNTQAIQLHTHEHKHNHEHCTHEHNHEHTHEHSHEHSHSHGGESEEEIKSKVIRFILGIVVFGAALVLKLQSPFNLITFLIAYAIFGLDVVITAVKNIFKGDFFDENFLMTIATLGAFVIGEYAEAVAVMLFYQIGEILQDIAVDHSRKSIKSMMDIRPDFAHKIIDNKEVTLNPSEVNINDYILVKAGEKVPLDGIVTEGTSQLDTKALTGESMPQSVTVGDEVLSGSINQSGLLKIKVTKSFGESTVTKILELVENASSAKAPTEKLITKFARYYTPAVVFIALAVAFIPPIIIPQAQFSTWLSRALIMLVISCPCAIVVSVPLGFFSGIGTASSKGILVKGSNYLQALTEVNTVIFDKTGTLTKGVFEVTKIEVANDCSKQDLLKYTAIAESNSNHPIAKSIIEKYNKEENVNIEDYQEIAGYGLKVVADNNTILVGNKKLMDKENLSVPDSDEVGTVVYTVLNGKYIGRLVISDRIKDDSESAIKDLYSLGIKNTIMLTGDRQKNANDVANKIGITKVYSELLPADKVEKLEKISNENKDGKLIFVGDGINDAPVLTRADIGIAMGGAGSDAAIEAADIVIMQDEPSKIAQAIRIAKHTNKIVWQNIIFALSIKIFILILGALGIANMWLAVFSDVGVTLLAVINSMRRLKD